MNEVTRRPSGPYMTGETVNYEGLGELIDGYAPSLTLGMVGSGGEDADATIDRLTAEVEELRGENTRLRRAIDLVEATIEAARQ